MGESKANNAGFLSARQGTPISELTHRNQFDAFEGVLQEPERYIYLCADLRQAARQRPGGGRIRSLFGRHHVCPNG